MTTSNTLAMTENLEKPVIVGSTFVADTSYCQDFCHKMRSCFMNLISVADAYIEK